MLCLTDRHKRKIPAGENCGLETRMVLLPHLVAELEAVFHALEGRNWGQISSGMKPSKHRIINYYIFA